MNQEQIAALLFRFTGHSKNLTGKEEKDLETIQFALADAFFSQDVTGIRNQEFFFENRNLLPIEEETRNTNNNFKQFADKISAKKEFGLNRVFVRNVPVRTTQIAGSTTTAAAGARVHTLGPVPDIHGIPHWFDFVKVKKLIALYFQGESFPAILFDAEFSQPKFFPVDSKPVELTKKFKLVPESVWIRTRIFSPEAPPDLYCGIRIKGGILTLNQDPVMDGGKLSIPAAGTVTCDIQPEQNNSFLSDPTSPFGVDARNAKFDMPETFQFSFTNSGKHIVAIGDSKWTVYGQDSQFKYTGNQNCIYNPFINRLAIPVSCSHSKFSVQVCKSPFFTLDGAAKIVNSWWALPVAKIDITLPPEADGNGALIIECIDGLSATWQQLKNKTISFPNPFILGEPGRIGITELHAAGRGAMQEFRCWKDERNPFGTTLECRFQKSALFLFNTVTPGDEMIFTVSDNHMQTDRPVKVNGEAVSVISTSSVFILAVHKTRTVYFGFDENMLWDHKLPGDQIPHVQPIALAMHNALFTVTPVNSFLLYAECSTDLTSFEKGRLYLAFGLFTYLPSLPDPYAANLGLLEGQFANRNDQIPGVSNPKRSSQVWMWLIGRVSWKPAEPEMNEVGVSFYFAPLTAALEIVRDEVKTDLHPNPLTEKDNQFQTLLSGISKTEVNDIFRFSKNEPMEKVSGSVSSRTNPLEKLSATDFALLDVSSKANQMGVSFAKINNYLQQIIARKYEIKIIDPENAVIFPLQIVGLDVVTAGINAQSFTVPAIAWEPVFNLTKPELYAGGTDSDGNPLPPPYDPPVGFNYYENDGIPTRIGNLSHKQVALSPIPLVKYLVETYRNKEDGRTFAMFNLPFGMLAITILNNEDKSTQLKKPVIHNTSPVFEKFVNGGIQLELVAGTSFSPDAEGHMFEGFTIQLININKPDGSPSFSSTLGGTPTQIFNNEFFSNASALPARPGVPLTNIGLSGYGASSFSDWENKEALFAQVSQAQFNVVTGRTSHEVVQVKSMLYPWGIRVVRTITLFRLANGYVARIDSGWQAESDGLYDFSWQKPILGPDGKTVIGKDPQPNPYVFHPGIVRGLFNVRNIKEQPKIYTTGSGIHKAILYAVTFDADVELENISEGGHDNRVPSKGVTGYVQIAPAGSPILLPYFQALLKSENNSIGGSVSCIIKVAGTAQRMKIDHFDVNNSLDAANNIIFVAAVRGSVIMPKDGSWSIVQHERKTGTVSPLPEQISVPLIRVGKWIKDQVINPADVANLLRIAHPADLLKIPNDSTINFGFLQNMGTQKVLFMTPGFSKGVSSLLSKTPPLLADASRLMNSKGIFPNIGNMESDFGQAISLLKGIDADNNPVDAFKKINLPDAGAVLNLLQLTAKEEAGKLLDQGYQLAKGAVNGIADKALKFDLPAFDYPLIDLPGKLVIKIQYKASSKPKGQPQKNYVGKFDFDVDSFAADLADTWKGRMNNLAMVVTIGPLTDIMKIKGNFNAQKGKAVDLGSSNASDDPGLNLPTPEIEFSDAVEPVIKILEILASLSTGDYAGALKKGLKVAMSNSANIWEYKFEASKDIPLVRFPPTNELYNSPATPLKLEASLGIGVFFNAALKVTTDPKQLLPTAGAFFKFHGGLQVMCVSVGVGTIYAVGSVDLKLEADTSPKIGVTMKFGFGAQITVGLPVVGHASVLFMVGVEIYADSSSKVKITAFMLFKGEAELLAGLVCVTITIEAKGSVEKAGPGTPTTCMAQVTFAIDISIFLIIDISFSESWQESRQIA